jgi:hypothetical protein
VHLKEDSGSTTRSEGERSRKSTKSNSGASESSTIVSSAAAIIAEEFKNKPPLQYSVEQAGASAEANEETARIKKDHKSDNVGKRPSSIPASSQSRAEVADISVPAVKKAVAAAVSTSVVAPIAEGLAKAESINSSSFADSAAESIGTEDSQSAAPESSWLIDDSPDDMSYLGGYQSDESLVPPEVPSGSAAAAIADDVVEVEEVVEVLDDEDIFAEEVAEAVLAEQPVEAVEVLEDEPVEVLDEVPVEAVELLDDETPANALTADFEEAGLFDNQFVEVLDEPEVLAEELVEAELIEEIEESAEIVEVLDDEEPVEVMEAVSVEPDPSEAELVEAIEEPFDFFEELGIVDDEPQLSVEKIAAVDHVKPAGELAAELVETKLVEDPVEVVQVLDDEAAVEVLEEPSDFFDMLGIEVDKPQQVIEQVVAAEAGGSVEEWLEEPVEAELVEEPAEVVQVPENDAATEVLEEPSDFFDMLGIEVDEPQQVIEQVVAVDATADSKVVEEFAAYEAEIEAVEEVEAVEEFDFFDDVETIQPVATVEQVDAVDEFDAELEEIELLEEVAEAGRVAEPETATEPVAEVTEAEIEELAVVEEVDAVEEAWDFAEVAAEDVVTADHESSEVVATEEFVEVAEEDDASNWFDIGDDKSEDDDDDELRKFLKGF